jgi:hypothetical protein
MRYETPQLTLSALAINAIQSGKTAHPIESPGVLDVVSAYEDWEE